ncbi:metacaspase 1 [Plasmodium gaboni]|uniref:Metacaspase 1 n=1 Tax=Plasmodium gaboni TaxID=647221 RepID=A0A151LEM0_9APIC|nr:metacaspase 1 [Plasmodium gaboni]KYN97316.1 metacaspase 1 [Plasmodium gaboni]
MEKIYVKIYELSGLEDKDNFACYIKIYWQNKKYKSCILQKNPYKFNETFLLPIDIKNIPKVEKNNILSIEVWSSGILNNKIAYTFFELDHIRRERISSEKINLIDVVKKCTLQLSVHIINNNHDIIFCNIKDLFRNNINDKEIQDAIIKYGGNQKDIIKELQKKKRDIKEYNNIYFNDHANVHNTVPSQNYLYNDMHKIMPNNIYNNMNNEQINHTYLKVPNSLYNSVNTHYSSNTHYTTYMNNSPTYKNSNNMNHVTNLYPSNDLENSNNFKPHSNEYNMINYDNNNCIYPQNHTNIYNRVSPYSEQILYFSSSNQKKALLIGINYYGTKYELNGCTNDTLRMKDLLVRKYQFYDSSNNIVRLIDNEANPNYRPTRRNILSALMWLTRDNKSGDILFFLFSGHGSQQKDHMHIEEDGYNETILPSDFETEGVIIDDELHKYLIQPLNEGVKLIAVVDSCNSGSSIDLAYKYKLKSKKWKEDKNPFHVICDVTQFSGCKDKEASYEVNTGHIAPGGSLVTAMVQILTNNMITPSLITYEYLLHNIHAHVKQYSNQTVTFMSSQKFNMDRVFDFKHIIKNKNMQLGQIINKYIEKNKSKNKNKLKHELKNLFFS